MLRGIFVNNQSYYISPEYQDFCDFERRTPKTSDNEHYQNELNKNEIAQVHAFFKRVLFNGNQKDFDKHYPKILGSYTQSILYPFKQAMHAGNGEDFVPLDIDFNAHLHFNADEVTLDMSIFNVNLTDMTDSSKVPVPIAIFYTNKLTDKGFQFSHGQLKGTYLQQVCLGQEMLDTNKEKIAAAVAENSDYFEAIVVHLLKSPFTDQVIVAIRQARDLYEKGDLTPQSYVNIANALCSIAEFPNYPKLLSIPNLTALFYLEDVKAQADFSKSLRAVAKDLHTSATDYLASDPSTRGFDKLLRELEACSNEPNTLIIVEEEEKNIFQLAWNGIKQFAKEHPIISALIGTTLLIAAVIGITIATAGVGTVGVLVGAGLTYLGVGGVIAGFITATAAIATTVAATAFAIASYATFAILTAGYFAIDWLKNKITAKPDAPKEPVKGRTKSESTSVIYGPDALNVRAEEPSKEDSASSSPRSLNTSTEREGSDSDVVPALDDISTTLSGSISLKL